MSVSYPFVFQTDKGLYLPLSSQNSAWESLGNDLGHPYSPSLDPAKECGHPTSLHNHCGQCW